MKTAAIGAWCVLAALFIHQGAIRPELRYSRVAEGNLSQSVHAMWAQGGRGYADVVRSDAAIWGRARVCHWLFYNVPFLLTLIRNGDVFHRDAEVPICDRLNGDLQTHSLFLLGCFGLALAALAAAVWRITGAAWPALLLPWLCVPGNSHLGENLLVNHCDSGEIGQLLWIAIYIALMAPAFAKEIPGRIREALAVFFLLLAYAMKETTVVLLPVALALLGWLSLGASRPFRAFALRQATCHVLLSAVLLAAVSAFKSGAYVSANYAGGHWADKTLDSWKIMANHSVVVPYGLIGGVFLAVLLLRRSAKSEPWPECAQASLALLLLATGLCVGFWGINVPWGAPMAKYYLPAHAFACLAGLLILQMSAAVLWRRRLRVAAILWLAGSLVFLFQRTGERMAATEKYYRQNYGYRTAVPAVAEDVARAAAGAGNGLRVHVVAGSLFQEGELPFLRWLNRFGHLNVASRGQVVAHMESIERNYFRRYAGAASVELTLSDAVPDDFAGSILYFLVRPNELQREQLRARGYVAAEPAMKNPTGASAWKFVKAN